MKQLSPVQTLSKAQARRFLLDHQFLSPPRRLEGRDGIMAFIQHVGCIQYDPINVVGRNPDLVLQSRIRKYRSEWLEGWLYEGRQLLDGWDKMRSIYHVEDWPYFSHHRAYMQRRYRDPSDATMKAAPEILKSLREYGPRSSIDFVHAERLEWSWGQSSSIAKASLDVLYAMGEIGIHHKIGSRRVFDLIDRLVSPELLSLPDPNPTEEDYQDWHILRRVGGLGLAHAGSSEYWGGMLGIHGSQQRETILTRLVERGELLPLSIEGLDGRTFYVRTQDEEALERAKKESRAKPRAAIIGALDNLLWDRNLIRWIFEFDYMWEVYKPVAQRKYGYYVLPILFCDRIIGPSEPTLDLTPNELKIQNWLWEE
ncbi:MAG: hypothetical protein A2Z14_12360, partial [Chloroflexi bacterium RBG_16_48_8]